MSEQQLKDFGARAETLVEIPDFAGLEQRGRHLRMRRRAGVAATLAAVLAIGGVAISQAHRTEADHGVVNPPPPVKAQPYPGATMKNLDAGRYRLYPSRAERDLTADLTLPAGWNAWMGPNRFDGHAPGRSNDEALGHLTWYVGALVIEVDSVNTEGCGAPVDQLTTPRQVVAALGRAYSMTVVDGPTSVRKFGYPATRLRLKVTRAAESCNENTTSVFHSTANGFVGYAYTGTLLNVWVVDVEGTPIYVQQAWTPNAPRHVRDELATVIESIRLTPGA